MNSKALEIQSFIKESGYKCTAARTHIIELFTMTKDHLKPIDVYERLKDYDISLPSVYRNIDLLKQLGILKEVSIHYENYYELSRFSQKKLHMHFRCDRCGQIKEYSDPHVFKEMIRQKENVEATYHDEIEDVTIVMTGVCRDCKKKNE